MGIHPRMGAQNPSYIFFLLGMGVQHLRMLTTLPPFPFHFYQSFGMGVLYLRIYTPYPMSYKESLHHAKDAQ